MPVGPDQYPATYLDDSTFIDRPDPDASYYSSAPQASNITALLAARIAAERAQLTKWFAARPGERNHGLLGN